MFIKSRPVQNAPFNDLNARWAAVASVVDVFSAAKTQKKKNQNVYTMQWSNEKNSIIHSVQFSLVLWGRREVKPAMHALDFENISKNFPL